MNNRGSGHRWVPWVAAGVLVAVLAGFNQGTVIIVLAVITAVLGLALLLVRGQRGRGAVLAAAGLVACLIGAAVLDSEPTTEPPTPSASAEASTAPEVSTPAPVRESPSPTASAEASQTPAPSASAEAPSPSPAPTEPEPSSGGELRAVDVLALLEIKGRAAKTGYDRDAFAYREVDLDRNGCDTRNDILNRDLQARTHRPGTDGCVVLTGMLEDPFSGEWISYVRGADTSSDVQIDHVVALSDAWQKGAQAWDAATLQAFGNDPLNLLAVSGPLNSQKGDGDAATWLPPNRSYRCDYVARQIAVKYAYELWVTEAEHEAMARILGSCPDQLLPEGAEPAQEPTTDVPTPGPVAEPSQAPSSPAPADDVPGEPSYANCSEVRAAGADPIRAGDPGWSPRFDGDGDGVGCE
ncbi:DUF1524 domain-containing protein [Ruania zhangjianzhongii]|uniref:GmrSD restriction endonuclease domain-containing protein n=1 Tax=Ruania zhangjianzhongii TaxID=2603206 RepID=UPI001F31B6CA|nr:DUF1524 domain-containing protein [Ruania zhangjianzhongii]